MGFIDSITVILNYILYGVIFLMVIGGAVFLYCSRARKRARLKEDEVDYSGLAREDSAQFVKFDDIRDDMIIMDGGRRFVGVIKCQGTDFYSAQEDEQASIASNFMAFAGTIDRPVTYRQYSMAVDMEDTLLMYGDALDRVQQELYDAAQDKKDLLANMKAERHMAEEEAEAYGHMLASLEKRMEALRFRQAHLSDQIAYIKYYSGNDAEPDRKETWVFDWEFDQMDFEADLSEEEVYQRAVKELHAMAGAKIHSLSNCGVKAKRCTSEELIEMCRYYSSPVSASRFKLLDVLKSSFFDDIVLSEDAKRIIGQASKAAAEDASDAMAGMLLSGMPMAGRMESPADAPRGMEEGAISADEESGPPRRMLLKRPERDRQEEPVERKEAGND